MTKRWAKSVTYLEVNSIIFFMQISFFITQEKVADQAYRVPHVGWNTLEEPSPNKWSDGLLTKTPNQTDAYFVHSFKVQPQDPDHILATTNYGGQTFCSAVQKDNMIGTQFHPEKSGAAGMMMLQQFCKHALKGVCA